MGVLAPKPGSSQTYIWRDTEVMAQISNSLPITVELKEDYSIHEGVFYVFFSVISLMSHTIIIQGYVFLILFFLFL